MTAAADLTPESTVDQPADAEAVADPTASTGDPGEAVEEPSDENESVGAAADDQSADAVESDADEPADASVDVDEPVAHEPVADESLAETVAEEPVAEPVAEEPVAEPVADEPTAEEPVAEEPVTEEPVADEPTAEEPVDDEPTAEEPVTEEPEAPQLAVPGPAVPGPAVPGPAVPGPAVPRPTPRPVPPRATPATEATPAAHSVDSSGEPWGRVDEDGTVSVREGDSWRVVGQYPDGSSDEALAYYERKYADLASEVGLLEVRHHRGGASAADLRSAARAVNAKLDGAAAVGDLASLVARVAALTESLSAASVTEAAAAREAVDEAVRTRTQLVEKVEAIAARDPRTVQWKQASADVSALFDQWQSDQQNGPRLPKSLAQQLWKRFRDARATFDKHRREFYAELDEAHKGVRDRKTRLVEKAEALAPKGEDGIPAYRELLDEWKTAGRAGKKVDDALWARFKAAGDALYSARIERESADAEASREKIEAKRALIEEARAVADERNIAKARTTLTGIQHRWDEIGRIFPRESERTLDDDLRKIEQALRTREEADWKRNNPETKARANEMTRQLTEAIQKLEDALAAAEKSGDKAAIAKAAEALDARRSWLNALGG